MVTPWYKCLLIDHALFYGTSLFFDGGHVFASNWKRLFCMSNLRALIDDNACLSFTKVVSLTMGVDHLKYPKWEERLGEFQLLFLFLLLIFQLWVVLLLIDGLGCEKWLRWDFHDHYHTILCFGLFLFGTHVHIVLLVLF